MLSSLLVILLWAVPGSGAAHVAPGVLPVQSSTALRRSASATTQLPHPVRFLEDRNRGLLVKVWINDSGPYNFVIDTGAGVTLLSKDLVATARLSPTRSSQTKLGGLSGTSVSLSTHFPISYLAIGDKDNRLSSRLVGLVTPNLPQGVDGILDPSSALMPFGYSIDFANHELRPFDTALSPLQLNDEASEGAVVRWVGQKQDSRPFVRLSDGRMALIDTGSSLGLAVSGIEGSDGSNHTTSTRVVRDLGGGTVRVTRGAPTTVSIGSLVLRRIPTDVLIGAGRETPVILGRDALYPFKISFDPVHRLIAIVLSRRQ